MRTSSNVLMENMMSIDADDVIWWVVDDLTRNAKISVNIYRFLQQQKNSENIYSSFIDKNRMQLNVQNNWQKLRK